LKRIGLPWKINTNIELIISSGTHKIAVLIVKSKSKRRFLFGICGGKRIKGTHGFYQLTSNREADNVY
jgi:hypothetical protein